MADWDDEEIEAAPVALPVITPSNWEGEDEDEDNIKVYRYYLRSVYNVLFLLCLFLLLFT